MDEIALTVVLRRGSVLTIRAGGVLHHGAFPSVDTGFKVIVRHDCAVFDDLRAPDRVSRHVRPHHPGDAWVWRGPAGLRVIPSPLHHPGIAAVLRCLARIRVVSSPNHHQENPGDDHDNDQRGDNPSEQPKPTILAGPLRRGSRALRKSAWIRLGLGLRVDGRRSVRSWVRNLLLRMRRDERALRRGRLGRRSGGTRWGA